MNILERYKKPTPKFFKVLRNLGVGLVTAAGSILAAPVAVPGWLLTVSTYVIVAGTVASAISQAAVDDNALEIEDDYGN